MVVNPSMKANCHCPLCAVHDEHKARLGYGLLWEAIPLYELLEEATAHAKECAPRTVEEIRQCAEKAVRAQICPCCASEQTIIDSVVDEFMRRLVAADSEMFE